MSIGILIDGYNLLHASTIVPAAGSQGTLQETRAALLNHLIEKLPAEWASRTTIVFDKGTERGLPAESNYGPLCVRFALKHAEADDLLEQLIQQHHAPRNLTVVSSDHRVQRAARRRRARAVDSDVWLDEVERLRRKPQDLPLRPSAPGPVSDWLATFADIDVAAIEEELDQEGDVPADEAHPAADTLAESDQPPLPPDAKEDMLSDPEMKKLLDEDQPLFPDGYGEDLLDEERYEE